MYNITYFTFLVLNMTFSSYLINMDIKNCFIIIKIVIMLSDLVY